MNARCINPLARIPCLPKAGEATPVDEWRMGTSPHHGGGQKRTHGLCPWGSSTQHGFTLPEVLVAGGILAVIGAIMLSFFIQGTSLWQLIIDQSDLRSDARNAINFMTQELRNATRTSGEVPSPNLSIPSKPNNNSIDFYLPSDMDDNGFIIDSIGGTEWDKSNKIQYQYIPGQKQLRRLEKGNQYIIANNVASIEFEDQFIDSALYSNELKIILKLEKAASRNRAVSVTLTSIVKLRNS